MQRMKTFGIYGLCVILFFIFSNIMIDVAIKSSYNPIDTYKIEEQGIELDILEAKATYVNGYIGGTIENGNDFISKTYLKIDLYSKNDICLGTKYATIENLEQGEKREFRMGFKFTDVEYAKIVRVNEIKAETKDEDFKSDNLAGAWLIATVILLCFFG